MNLEYFINHIIGYHEWSIPPNMRDTLFDIPLIGTGASQEQVSSIQSHGEFPIDPEYCEFIRKYGYVVIGEKMELCGIGNGISSPWFSDKHKSNESFWVLGDFSQFGDGDQLLQTKDNRYILYLHENGPEFRHIGNNFSELLKYIISITNPLTHS
jgi:hypothetical protein